MSERTKRYVYTGPDDYHGFVGQVLTYLGYTRHEDGPPMADVRIDENADGAALTCSFRDEAGRERRFGPQRFTRKSELKELLLSRYREGTGAAASVWGVLTGVRPTKLVHRLFDEGVPADEAVRRLQRCYGVAPDTAAELVAVAAVQRPYVLETKKKAALYVGIPYCSSHCLYCSFPSRLIGVETASRLHDFVAAVTADLEAVTRLVAEEGLEIGSVYVGGGTPTSLPADALAPILKAVEPLVGPGTEWTVEAGRPDTATDAKLALLRRSGVTRISINPQTMQQRLLDTLSRRHSVADIYAMFAQCRKLGFPIINMDFIAGLPGQTVADMASNMETVCQLRPENVTIHTLALKKGAPLFRHPLRAEIPSEKTVEEMLSLTRTGLAELTYTPYYLYRQQYMAAAFANVGYALPKTISAYNIEMMAERQTVLGVGPGSATKFVVQGKNLEKMYMPKDIGQYIRALPERIERRRYLCAAVYEGVNS